MPQPSWYDNLNLKLTKRVLRPTVQPGVIDRRLVNAIFRRSQWFNSRLSLLNYFTNRQGVKNIQVEPVPIVYAQPLLTSTDVISLSSPQSAVSQSASPTLASPPLPLSTPGERSSKMQPLIVQAKFINSTSSSTVNSPSISSASEPAQVSVNQQLFSQNLIDSPLIHQSLNPSFEALNNNDLTTPPSQVNQVPIVQRLLAPSIASTELTTILTPTTIVSSVAPSPSNHVLNSIAETSPNPDLNLNTPLDVSHPTRRSQRVNRIPPLPPLRRLNTEGITPSDVITSSEATPWLTDKTLPIIPQPLLLPQRGEGEKDIYKGIQSPSSKAEERLGVRSRVIPSTKPIKPTKQIQSKRDREQLINRPVQQSQVTSIQPLPGSQPPGIQPISTLPVVQVGGNDDTPMATQRDHWQGTQQVSLIYSHAPMPSTEAGRIMPGSLGSAHAIAASHPILITPQTQSLHPEQEFNQTARVTPQSPATKQQADSQRAAIDINVLAEKVQRKLLRQLTVETERRGHSTWH